MVRRVNVIGHVNLGGEQDSTSPQRNIHRIRSKAAFERLGGKMTPIDFDKMDLVIVNGWLGCAKGQVEIETEKQTAIFSVKITEQCSHLNASLCMKPYVGHYSVSKNIAIAPYVYIKGRSENICSVDIRDLSKNPKATHLELNSCGVTDADMEKLKEFKNLRHLQLRGNRITDKGLANLSHMTNLIHLYLVDNIGITDEGLKNLRDRVSRKIQELGVRGTSVTYEGLEKLRE